MEILKFGLIGILIMMPLLFISHIKEQSIWEREKRDTYIEKSIGEATYDAAFAIKTYSEAAYDGVDNYHIIVPYEAVVDIFFEHLTYRDFPYVKSDFLFLVFIDYDGVVIYEPGRDFYHPKQFYMTETPDEWVYVTLSGTGSAVNKRTGTMGEWALRDLTMSDAMVKNCVLETLEDALNRCEVTAYPNKRIQFNLPLYDDSFITAATSDLSFVALYERETSDLTEKITLAVAKPSGVMKILPSQ